MKELQIFQNSEFGKVGILEIDRIVGLGWKHSQSTLEIKLMK